MNDETLFDRTDRWLDYIRQEICRAYLLPYKTLFGAVMKRKYEEMIDRWVKKHYGDLERGVLSDEVKYKVLFKIYRKKYKEEKALRKHLEKTMKDWCSQNKALELPEDLDRKLFPWRLAPSPDKVLPKDDGFNSLADGIKRYLRETCEECRYYKKWEDGDKDVCTKHDKFVTPTCTCFEWEKKQEEEHKAVPTVTHLVAPMPDGFPDTVDSSGCDKSLCLTCSHMYTEHSGARRCTLGREVTETRVGCANYAKYDGEEHPLCDTCKHQDKAGEFCEQDLVQNKTSDCYEYEYKPDPEARPDCVHCKYSKMIALTDYMGAATSVLYCEKKRYKCDLLDARMCEYFEEKEK